MLRQIIRPIQIVSVYHLATNSINFSSCSDAKSKAPDASIAAQGQPLSPLGPQEQMKRAVGYASVDNYIISNMNVGLGTGSTAYYAVERIGQKLKSGELKNIICVPTSEKTKRQALELNIPLTTLDALVSSKKKKKSNSRRSLDVTIDGADEVDMYSFDLIKGGGGALLREKMVEKASKKFICIVDETKCVVDSSVENNWLSWKSWVDYFYGVTKEPSGIGVKFPIPIEITPFCYKHTVNQIVNLPLLKDLMKESPGDGSTDDSKKKRNGNVNMRYKKDSSELYVTDNGNFIVDISTNEPISHQNVLLLDKALYDIVGVVEHGLFVNMADVVIVGQKDGSIKILKNKQKISKKH